MKPITLLSFSTAFVSAALVAFVAAGCGDDDDNTAKPDSGTDTGSSSGTSGTSGTSGSSGDGSTKPQPPTIGAQIDRMGRPAVNTAVNKTFAGGAARDPARDTYNADKDNAGWAAKYTAEVAGNLAIYDGVDRNCGNQAFAK